MTNVVLVTSDLSLIREWMAENPDANVWVYGNGLPRHIDGLEGRVLPATLTLKQVKGLDHDEVLELPLKKSKAKKAAKVEEDEQE
jgi:hypothetical protein